MIFSFRDFRTKEAGTINIKMMNRQCGSGWNNFVYNFPQVKEDSRLHLRLPEVFPWKRRRRIVTCERRYPATKHLEAFSTRVNSRGNNIPNQPIIKGKVWFGEKSEPINIRLRINIFNMRQILGTNIFVNDVGNFKSTPIVKPWNQLVSARNVNIHTVADLPFEIVRDNWRSLFNSFPTNRVLGGSIKSHINFLVKILTLYPS